MNPERFAQIPLDAAVVCENCRTISNTYLATCPHCQSNSLWQLARVIDRKEAA